ncbi:hypothetical protein GQ55_4G339700 [Panicum hallii var. hallii]|uniref:Uncharacterized protein n=1 Tax=Panicum hallii var. hallii TaxID=1504633 RepID=A0A2T7E309_9POAL|nr:hypothetical protein GQ55_4G339700 [Panicum hallii var. hallii]
MNISPWYLDCHFANCYHYLLYPYPVISRDKCRYSLCFASHPATVASESTQLVRQVNSEAAAIARSTAASGHKQNARVSLRLSSSLVGLTVRREACRVVSGTWNLFSVPKLSCRGDQVQCIKKI